jgi:hypothetical protein
MKNNPKKAKNNQISKTKTIPNPKPIKKTPKRPLIQKSQKPPNLLNQSTPKIL